MGAWEACTESCGSGTKNRTVSCVEHDGTVVADHYCTGLEPEHQAYCNDYPCDFCSTTDCSSEVRGPPFLLLPFAMPFGVGQWLPFGEGPCPFSSKSGMGISLPCGTVCQACMLPEELSNLHMASRTGSLLLCDPCRRTRVHYIRQSLDQPMYASCQAELCACSPAAVEHAV